MHTQPPARTPFLVKGALIGAATFSAYAVLEFFFSSVVYRLTRPYAIFTPWHWKLTAILLLGYLFSGAVIGTLAGLWARRREDAEERGADVVDAVCCVALAAALILNNLTGPGLMQLGNVQITAAAFFLVILLISISSADWRERFGWLTSPWIVALTWLGIGLFSSLRLRASEEPGGAIRIAATGLAIALVVVAVAAWFVGRIARRDRAERVTLWVAAGSCTAGVLLLLASTGLSFDAPSVRAAAAGGTGSTRSNLMVIVMDTVRADHLSLNGYGRDTTPHLRALAHDGVVYRNAFSASDITLTSHASLFTGMYPSWHNAYSEPPTATYGRELSPKYPTLTEILHREGYETIGVAANLYLRADFGLERGFDEFRIPRPVPLIPDEDRSVLRYQLRRGLSFVFDTAQFDRLYTFGEDIDREFFSALNERQKHNQPYYAFLNYMDAHYPYVPPPPYSSRYPGRRPRMTQDDLDVDQDIITKGQGQPAEYRPHCESQYDGGIAYIDEQIGQVIDTLKRRGEYDNTMIVVTSDHGESFGDKNRVGHANSPYQNLLHVALLIKYPKGERTGVEDRPVSLIDVAPTALTALGLTPPETMQGVSLMNGAPAPRRIYAETFKNPVTHSPDCPAGCLTKMIVEWPLKYIENLTNGKPEFFDLSSDPQERHNLFATQRERAEVVAADLAEWRKLLPAQAVEVKRVNPAIENTLRGNGYVGK